MTAARDREQATVVEYPALVRGLPDPPPQSLDAYLDAAVRCFVRYGVHRTSVQDVAAEMRVNRTTVYRQVGTVDAILRLVTARAIHRIVDEASRRIDFDAISPEAIVTLLSDLIAMVRSEPVMRKILYDELDLVGAMLGDLPSIFERVASAVVPTLTSAMEAGLLAKRDAPALAEWMARIAGSCVLAPPPGDLTAFLGEVLGPALEPGRRSE